MSTYPKYVKVGGKLYKLAEEDKLPTEGPPSKNKKGVVVVSRKGAMSPEDFSYSSGSLEEFVANGSRFIMFARLTKRATYKLFYRMVTFKERGKLNEKNDLRILLRHEDDEKLVFNKFIIYREMLYEFIAVKMIDKNKFPNRKKSGVEDPDGWGFKPPRQSERNKAVEEKSYVPPMKENRESYSPYGSPYDSYASGATKVVDGEVRVYKYRTDPQEGSDEIENRFARVADNLFEEE